MKDLIHTAVAQALTIKHLPAVRPIECPLSKCAGRILRQPIHADRPFPPFNRSMMDGYALRVAEIKQHNSFKITAQAMAGAQPIAIGNTSGQCVEIMTGAVVPDDADCVVPYEETEELEDGHIRLLYPDKHASGNCIHKLGSDHPAGEVLLSPGRLIGSREVAIAASCGYTNLQVSKIPSICIVSTGDELVEIANKPAAHQIRRSNDIAVETALARLQLHAKTLVHLPDERTTSQQQLTQIIKDNEFVIITGGVSMGKKDYIPDVLNELGLDCHFHGVRQKPGKPFGYWSRPDCSVFALPGNPLSVLISLHRYVIPALQRALGQNESSHSNVKLSQSTKCRNDITVFLPIELDANGNATPLPAQNSGDLVSILASSGFIELQPNAQREYPQGSRHRYISWL